MTCSGFKDNRWLLTIGKISKFPLQKGVYRCCVTYVEASGHFDEVNFVHLICAPNPLKSIQLYSPHLQVRNILKTVKCDKNLCVQEYHDTELDYFVMDFLSNDGLTITLINNDFNIIADVKGSVIITLELI